jgi:hypothetical protein
VAKSKIAPLGKLEPILRQADADSQVVRQPISMGSRGKLEEGAGNAMEGQDIESNTLHLMAIVSRVKTKYLPFRRERSPGAGGTSS